MTEISHEEVDKISDIFRSVFRTDIIIVKVSDDGTKYNFALPGFCVGDSSQDLVNIMFDVNNNTIIHNSKTMEFNDAALEYLQSLVRPLPKIEPGK